jgi:uncharacterized protein YndB with AHSA1/START domain
MYQFGDERILQGDIDRIWAVWTDFARFPEWDPREEMAEIEGPFVAGATIRSKQKGNPGGTGKITRVESPSHWTGESPLPGGKLIIDHFLEPAGDGKVKVAKRYQVHGPLTVVFRLYFGPRVRKSISATLAALEQEALRRG